MEQNQELRTAWEFVENTGRSIFLTGKAGTGKTTFLKTVVERSRKRPIVVAPTGVAAINAGGVTIHSFFQLPLSPYVPGAKTKERFDFSKQKRQLIASVDLLIIDEISMVRADLLDAIDDVLRRYRDHTKPFGGLQLLMIGDLAQLTPVVTPADERLLRGYYDTPYFFGSKALQQTDYVTIQLEKVYRQQDNSFISILNDIRHGHPSAQTLQLLNSRYVMPPQGQSFIRLTTHNQLADHYNETELARLTGKMFWYKAEVDGTFPEYSFPTSATMVLKVGAQVMFIKNDPTNKHRYYNGRIGHVTYVDEKKVLVLCEGDEKAIEVEPLEWENARYTINPETREIVTDVQGTFRQLPLRLAWAITIHKSQGLTFDRVVIDAGQSFAPGQVYVALSRCRTLEGLFLATPIEGRAVINDQRVEGYIAHQEQAARESIEQLPVLRQEYERHLLLQLFDFRSLFLAEESMVRLMAEYFMRSHSDLMQLHNQTYAALRQQVMEVSLKWTAQIKAMPLDGLHQQAFLDRVGRSAAYFAQQIDTLMMKPIQLSATIESKNKRAMSRLSDILPELRQQWFIHRTLLAKMAETEFNVTTYLKERQMTMLDAADDQALRRLLKPKKEKTTEVTFRLFSQGMTKEQIAVERGLTTGTVMGHLASLVGEGRLKIEQIITPERRQKIEKVVRAVGLDNGTTAIKNLCPPDVSWDELRMVIANMPHA
ncbi:MAG: helix-turn-helix domain-containing protein [Prevotella sp.]|nr:helix-turn-helix domain-containing protein [Prevotella sp.]